MIPFGDVLPSALEHFLASEPQAKPVLTRHRSLFISDLHLGAPAARADLALRFLQENHAETLFLVGDIVDNWHPLATNWKDSHHAVIQHILHLARNGTRVVYLPGNHDAFFRRYAGHSFGGIEVALNQSHIAADGRRYLVTHGDCCDVFARHAPLLSRLVGSAESLARRVEALLKRLARGLGRRETQIIQRLVDLTNGLIRASDRFEHRLVALARNGGYDGIICGHYHKAALQRMDGILYANCGDWVGGNTALVEDHGGNLRLIGLPEPALVLQDHSAPQGDGQMLAVL